MAGWTGFMLAALAVANLLILGTSRVKACIRIVAVQGACMGVLPLLAMPAEGSIRAIAIAAFSVALKGIIFPWFLFRAIRGSEVRREMDPIVGYTASILSGLVIMGASIWIAGRTGLDGGLVSPLALPVALATTFTGLFIIVSRRKALTQVLGYILMENGIFAFAFAQGIEAGFLVELGIMLDALLAVAVMGVAIFHIYRAFDVIDADHLCALKDWK